MAREYFGLRGPGWGGKVGPVNWRKEGIWIRKGRGELFFGRD